MLFLFFSTMSGALVTASQIPQQAVGHQTVEHQQSGNPQERQAETPDATACGRFVNKPYSAPSSISNLFFNASPPANPPRPLTATTR